MKAEPSPLVSVVIPTYKHRDTILDCLRSVFGQTYAKLEIIVVNDGSPDDTEEILRSSDYFPRIIYRHQANQGQAAARNHGISIASGKYIALLDDDDMWPPDKVDWQVAELEANPRAVLAYGSCRQFHDKSELKLERNGEATHVSCPHGSVLKDYLWHNWITSPGQTLIRRKSIEESGRFNPEIWGSDDYDLYVRLAAMGNFCYQSKVALYYRVHGGNASRDIDRMYLNNRLARRRFSHLYRGLGGLFLKLKASAYQRRRFSNLYFKSAAESAEQGKFGWARRQLRKAFVIRPSVLIQRRFVLLLCKLTLPRSGM